MTSITSQAYRYNSFNKTWVRWTIDARAGLVNSSDDKLYIGSGDSAFIKKERKNGDRTDFADEDQPLTLPSQVILPDVPELVVSSLSGVSIGDVLLQEQFVTKAKFNRLLRKLDTDAGLDDSDYIDLAITTGSDLPTAMLAVVAKVDEASIKAMIN